MGIDAPWGAGKTTFLKMWAQHMHNEGFPVVEFNAWETDFSQDPFIALAAELERGLGVEPEKDLDKGEFSSDADPADCEHSRQSDTRKFNDEEVEKFSEQVSQVAVQVLNQQQISNQLIVKGDLLLSADEPLDLLSVIQDAMDSQQVDQADAQNNIQQAMQGQNIAQQGTLGQAEARRSQYQQAVKSFRLLRDALEAAVSPSLKPETSQITGHASDPTDESAAPHPTTDASRSEAEDAASQAGDLDPPSEDSENAAGASEKRRPLVVFIDELDRCRPTYAIELLEVAKHLFAVDGVVFVLGVNRSELAKSVKAVYGDAFDAEGYLHRFFDVDIRLPNPDRKKFIDTQLQAIGLNDFLDRTEDTHASGDSQEAQDWLLSFFGASALGLRDIQQALHRLGLLLGSLESNKWSFVMPTIFLMILRTIDRSAYDNLINGTASDKQIIDKVFSIPSFRVLRDEEDHQKACLLFEAMAIIGAWELRERTGYRNRRESVLVESEMLKHYHTIVNSAEPVDPTGEDTNSPRPASPASENGNLNYVIKDTQYAKELISKVDSLHKIIDKREWPVKMQKLGFYIAKCRLELI